MISLLETYFSQVNTYKSSDREKEYAYLQAGEWEKKHKVFYLN